VRIGRILPLPIDILSRGPALILEARRHDCAVELRSTSYGALLAFVTPEALLPDDSFDATHSMVDDGLVSLAGFGEMGANVKKSVIQDAQSVGTKRA